MHFGKALESARSPRFGQGYLEYGYLKKELKRLLQEDPRQLKDWIAVLEAEISRVDKFAAARVEDAKAAISQLSRQVGALKAVQASPAELARLESLAMEVSAGLVDLADFIELNKTAVSKVSAKRRCSERAVLRSVLDGRGGRARHGVYMNRRRDASNCLAVFEGDRLMPETTRQQMKRPPAAIWLFWSRQNV